MGMKSKMGMIMAMAMMFGGASMVGASPTRRRFTEPQERMKSNKEKVEGLAYDFEQHQQQFKDQKNFKQFTIQGFPGVYALNQKGAIKKMRKILGQNGFHPNMTKDEFEKFMEQTHQELKEKGDESWD